MHLPFRQALTRSPNIAYSSDGFSPRVFMFLRRSDSTWELVQLNRMFSQASCRHAGERARRCSRLSKCAVVGTLSATQALMVEPWRFRAFQAALAMRAWSCSASTVRAYTSGTCLTRKAHRSALAPGNILTRPVSGRSFTRVLRCRLGSSSEVILVLCCSMNHWPCYTGDISGMSLVCPWYRSHDTVLSLY